MRDLLIFSIVAPGALAALRWPWIGVLLWTWLSMMNPHRYAFGMAYDAPLAAVAAVATLIGLLATRHRSSPFKGPAPVILVLFMFWITLSWLMGLDVRGDYEQWTKIMKILFMTVVALALLETKQQVIAFVWVCALSLALLGAKGGVFTIATGGNHRVWGPEGSFIGDNNAFALALVMTIPLLRFLQLQLSQRWARHSMTVMMILVAASALGSHSRGALLAIGAMSMLLWWRGRSKFMAGIVIACVGAALVAFMPDDWSERMRTIETYDEDRSALGRFAAWSMAWNLAFHYPFGVGLDAARPELFLKFSPYGLELGTPAAHSVYFQVLGNHGFVGLGLFLALWLATLRMAGKVRKESRALPQAQWCFDLASMCQVSLLGYAVGGAFLSLSYFDLPYNIMVVVSVTLVWVRTRGWEREEQLRLPWFRVPGGRLQSEAAR